ncbi:MAG: alanine racemase [Rhodocyclaceae bacterium]|nr:alanine racemase [Rhodocyclaceae bacterium]
MLTQSLCARWQVAGPAEAGSRELTALAEAHGTPLFATRAAMLDERLAQLRAMLPAGMRVLYSVKANARPEVLARLGLLVDGFDVASSAELELARAAAAPGSVLAMTGPGKRDDDLAAALAADAVVVLESLDEGARLARAAGERRPRVLLRINPPFELAAESRMSGGPRKFGVDSEQAGAALAGIGELPLDFLGFHIYPGSNCLNAQAIANGMHATLSLAAELAAQAPAPVRVLNLGGGFGIPCLPGEASLALDRLGESLGRLASEASRRLPEATLCVELGRFLVGEAGVYLSRVVERKVSRGRVYLILDGGLNHHWQATGALEGRRHLHYPIWVVGGAGRPMESVTVCGPLCAPHDTWAEHLNLPRAEPGDLVAVFQSGAYTTAISPGDFMLRPPPAQLLV